MKKLAFRSGQANADLLHFDTTFILDAFDISSYPVELGFGKVFLNLDFELKNFRVFAGEIRN